MIYTDVKTAWKKLQILKRTRNGDNLRFLKSEVLNMNSINHMKMQKFFVIFVKKNAYSKDKKHYKVRLLLSFY